MARSSRRTTGSAAAARASSSTQSTDSPRGTHRRLRMLARSLADAEMDRRLRRYAAEAHARKDPLAIRDAERARQIRSSPKFLALVDLVPALDLAEPSERRRDRVQAVAALLNTASI